MALHQFAVFIFNENDNSNFDQILQLTKDKDNMFKKRKKKGKKEDSKEKDSKNSNESQDLNTSSEPSSNSPSINSTENIKDKNTHNLNNHTNITHSYHHSNVSLLNQISLKKSDSNVIKNIMNEFELDRF